MGEPLFEAKVLELRGAENLQELHGLVLAQILDVVRHPLGHDAHIAGYIVERPRRTARRKDGNSRPTSDEEGPLVRRWVPVHLTQAARIDEHVGRRDPSRDREVARVGDPDFAAGSFQWLLR